MIRKPLAWLFLVTMFSTGALPAAAQVSPEDLAEAGAMIQTLGDDAIEILNDPGTTPEQRDDAFREMMRSALNLDYLAQLALGRHWRRATPEERSAYLDVFDDYLLHTITSRLTGIDLESQIVSGQQQAGKRDIFVDADIIGGGDAYTVRWRLRRFDNGLKIINLNLESFSMMITTREEFSSVVNDKGMAGLVQAMLDKIEDMKAKTYSASANN